MDGIFDFEAQMRYVTTYFPPRGKIIAQKLE